MDGITIRTAVPADLDAVVAGGGSLLFRQRYSGASRRFTSPSRFVRLAFLKKYGVKGKNEKDGVTRLFHMMHHAAFPPGLAVVGEPGENMPYDERMVPYDYTIYTSVMCAQSGRFYWTTFENMNIRCAALAI